MQITDQGESTWLFESKPRFTPHAGEARVFWWSLYLFTAAWVLLAFVAILKLNFSYLVRGGSFFHSFLHMGCARNAKPGSAS